MPAPLQRQFGQPERCKNAHVRVPAPLGSLDERVLTWLASKALRRRIRWTSRQHIRTPGWTTRVQAKLNRLDERFAVLQTKRTWAWIIFAIGLLAITATVLLWAL